MSNILIKKIDKLLLRTFTITLILLVALVLFIMATQNFFILFSAVAGKGLGFGTYAKLIYYLSLNILPNVFPIAILMASLIVFGNFSESFELTAMRSVGLSLQRILRLPFIIVFCLSGGILYFQNYVYPNSKHKIFALVADIYKKKSALFIQEGIVCNNIPGYSIRVDKKLVDNEHMEGIIVYDHTKKYGKVFITAAEKGRLYTTPDEAYLVMELTNGHNYVEPSPKRHDDNRSDQKASFYRNKFLAQKIRISLEALKLGTTNAKFACDARTRTYPDLKKMIEERRQEILNEEEDSKKFLLEKGNIYHIQKPLSKETVDLNTQKTEEQIPSFSQEVEKIADKEIEQKPDSQNNFMIFRNKLMERKLASDMEPGRPTYDYSLDQVVKNALSRVEKIKNTLRNYEHNKNILYQNFNEAAYEKEHRFAIAMRCMIMFLLAAPLGCLIRRGGFGISVMIGSFFMLLEYILSISGRDSVLAGTISSFIGAWLPNFVLLPFCCFFLRKAQQGRGLYTGNWYPFYRRIKRMLTIRRYCITSKKTKQEA